MIAWQNMFRNYQNLTKSFYLRNADLLLYVKNIIVKNIDLYFTDCDIPLCVQCASSKEHQHHKTVKGKRGRLKLDLQELEKYIYPKYQEIKSYIRDVKTYINKNSKKLRLTLETRRKVWYGNK